MASLITAFPSGISSFGMPVIGAGPFIPQAGVAFLSSVTGGDGNDGLSLATPKATLAAAITAVGANGTIFVGPGHAETISSATALTLSTAGITVYGLGLGALRPTFTLDSLTTATINITAAEVSFVNCLFKANLAAIVALFTLTTAVDFGLYFCEFRDNSSILNFVNIVDTDATTNHADGLTISACKRFGAGATANTCIVKMDGTNDRLTIKDSYFTHAATTQAGLMPIATGKVVTNAEIAGNTVNLVGSSGATTGILITTDGTTNSGVLSRNLVQSLDATTEILVTASSGFVFFNNYYSGAADKSGYLLPAADA